MDGFMLERGVPSQQETCQWRRSEHWEIAKKPRDTQEAAIDDRSNGHGRNLNAESDLARKRHERISYVNITDINPLEHTTMRLSIRCEGSRRDYFMRCWMWRRCVMEVGFASLVSIAPDGFSPRLADIEGQTSIGVRKVTGARSLGREQYRSCHPTDMRTNLIEAVYV